MRTVSAVLCVLLLCSMALAAPKVLFEDDFTGDLDQWIMTNAGWEIVDEALEFPIVGFSDIFTGEDWDDYVVEADDSSGVRSMGFCQVVLPFLRTFHRLWSFLP